MRNNTNGEAVPGTGENPERTTPGRSPIPRGRLAWVVLAPIVSIFLIEAGFRTRAWHRNHVTLEAAFHLPAQASENVESRFVDIIRSSANDKLIYELLPDLDTTFKGQPLRTNSSGFRSPEIPLEADEGTVTIVGIGASIMFGHGVGDGEEYAPLLEAALNERHPQREWRFINTAVPSYNVVMKVEALQRKGLAYQPDVVLLNIASNNLGLPNYVRVEEDPYDPSRSFLLDYFLGWSARKDETNRHGKLAHVSAGDLSWGSMIQTDPRKVPVRYRGLVGWDPFYEALDRLKGLSDEHGFEVIVFATLNADLVVPMLDAARERDFAVITLHKEIIDHMLARKKRVNTRQYMGSDLVVSPSNGHPSPLQHRMAAEKLLSGFEELGLVDRLLHGE